jgi:hypothetical protein
MSKYFHAFGQVSLSLYLTSLLLSHSAFLFRFILSFSLSLSTLASQGTRSHIPNSSKEFVHLWSELRIRPLLVSLLNSLRSLSQWNGSQGLKRGWRQCGTILALCRLRYSPHDAEEVFLPPSLLAMHQPPPSPLFPLSGELTQTQHECPICKYQVNLSRLLVVTTRQWCSGFGREEPRDGERAHHLSEVFQVLPSLLSL